MKSLFNGKLVITTFKELETVRGYIGIEPTIQFHTISKKASKFGSHDGYEFISLNIPDSLEPDAAKRRLFLYLQRDLLVFVGDSETLLDDILSNMENDEQSANTLEQMLYLFFNKLTEDDSITLEMIDEEISALEEAFMTSSNQRSDDYKKIIDVRKKLLSLKLYYGQLVDIAESIEENHNQYFSTKAVHRFHLITKRVERLYDMILDLQDYLSQVREGYQAQIDIDQNKIMKLFTVITVIFMPLTLIVGWYGMNLQMPEFAMPYTYPVVIALCIAVSSFSIYYFRKHHWF